MSTSSRDLTVRTWITDPHELVELADRKLLRIGREFIAMERASYGDLLGR